MYTLGFICDSNGMCEPFGNDCGKCPAMKDANCMALEWNKEKFLVATYRPKN